MKILALLAVLLLVPVAAHAWTDNISWATGTNTTSYKVETSVDLGTTWVVAGTPTTPAMAITLTSTGLTLIRVSNCNANGCTTRAGSGFFHNEAWSAPLAPSNLMEP